MRINKLLPEILDEIKFNTKPKEIDKFMVKTVANIWNRLPINSKKIDPKYLPANKVLHPLIDKLAYDESYMSMIKNYALYKRHKGKNYIVDKEFFQSFKQISLEKVQFKHIPKNVYGFMELPEIIQDNDGDKIKGFFFSTPACLEWYNSDKNQAAEILREYGYKMNNATHCFSMAWFYENGGVGFSTHPIGEPDVFIKDFLKDCRYTEAFIFRNETKTQVNGFQPEIALMINLLAYLNSGDPDLREFRNKINYRSPNSTKVSRKDQNLSQSDITLIGFNWKKSPLYTKESWYVPPYWANRRYGVGRKLEKLVLVAGSPRSRKTLKDKNERLQNNG